MSNWSIHVKKCDRCFKLQNDDNNREVFFSWGRFGFKQNNGPMKNKDSDICDECLKQLWEWWNLRREKSE